MVDIKGNGRVERKATEMQRMTREGERKRGEEEEESSYECTEEYI